MAARRCADEIFICPQIDAFEAVLTFYNANISFAINKRHVSGRDEMNVENDVLFFEFFDQFMQRYLRSSLRK
ncbi:hypothetical protein G163CM_44700 [Pseudocitrobacter corydidari]|uniref:Uncharacterized protein n=1 Tax=Pseudocitrobacter corydidari TaxID=2891570 RepID=A0ABY3SDJ0_9ENTR|nr:hypothetical protein G163CM_44700 [Pseudocitrobacter corydidari]